MIGSYPPETNEADTIIVQDNAGSRLDRFLTEWDNGQQLSRARIERLIQQGNVVVNERVVRKSYRVEKGDVIEIRIPEPEPVEIIPQDIPLKIVWEDKHLAVINKPAGLTVHPGAGRHDGTLVNAIVHRYRDRDLTGGDPSRPGIVHRLDRETSGLMVIALDEVTHRRLSELFSRREVRKVYQTVVMGELPAQTSGNLAGLTCPLQDPEFPDFTGEIVLPIGRDPAHRIKMRTSAGHGREARTLYRTLETTGMLSLAEVRILTGRTHQIRVHLSHIQHPVAGDRLYSSLKRELSWLPANLHSRYRGIIKRYLGRQALHAGELGFHHPHTGVWMEFEKSPPADFQKFWDEITRL